MMSENTTVARRAGCSLLKVVDNRDQYRKRLSVEVADGIERHVCRLAMRYRLSGEVASKIADLIASEIEDNRNDKITGISRVEAQGRQRSRWYARIFDASNRTAKSFYDSKYGGKSHALEEAVKWLEKTVANMELPEYDVSCNIGAKQLSKEERKTIVDKLLEKHGKCFILTGTGPLAANAARLMGQCGKTIYGIRHGKQDGFCLGQSKIRAEVNGFINEITPDVENEIRLAVDERKQRWMSSEEVENAVSSCMLSYASVDLSQTTSDYIKRLAGCVIKIAKLRHHRKKTLSLDINGSVEYGRCS